MRGWLAVVVLSWRRCDGAQFHGQAGLSRQIVAQKGTGRGCVASGSRRIEEAGR